MSVDTAPILPAAELHLARMVAVRQGSPNSMARVDINDLLNLISAAASGYFRFATKSAMDADTSKPAGSLAYVYANAGSPSDSNNGFYQWGGSTWVRATWISNDLISSVQSLVDEAETARDEAVAAAGSATAFTVVNVSTAQTAAQVKTAIQNAITSSAGRLLRICGNGEVPCNARILLSSNTRLRIDRGLVLVKPAGQTGPMFENSGCEGSTANIGIEFEGGTIKGNGDPVTHPRTGVIGEIALIGVSDGFLRNVKFDNCQRGVQHQGDNFIVDDVGTTTTAALPVTFHGPSSGQIARRVRHRGAGHAVSLVAAAPSAQCPVMGDIADWSVEDVSSAKDDGGQITLVSGTQSGTLRTIKPGTIHRLRGTAGAEAAILLKSSGGAAMIEPFTAADIYVKTITGSRVVDVQTTAGGGVIEELRAHPASTGGELVSVATTGSVDEFDIELLGRAPVDGASPVALRGAAKQIRLSGSYEFNNADDDNAAITLFGNATARLDTLAFVDFSQKKGGALLYKSSGSAAVATDVFIADTQLDGAKRAFFAHGSDVAVRASGFAARALTVNLVRAHDAAVTWREVNGSMTLGGGATEIVTVGSGSFTRLAGVSLPGEVLVTNPGAAHTEIQAALTAVAGTGGHVRIIQPGTLTITGTLVASSGTHLIFGPATTLRKAAGQATNPTMIRNATMPNPASYAASDSDITIEGGIFDGQPVGTYPSGANDDGAGVGAIPAGCTGNILLFGVTRATVRNVCFRPARTAAIQIVGDDFLVENARTIGGEYPFDFVHINGPSRGGRISGTSAHTHDDIIAINAWDWRKAGPTVGDITDVMISATFQRATASGVTGGGIRLLSGTRDGTVGNVRRITVDGVSGIVGSGVGAVYCSPTPDATVGAGPGSVPTGGVVEDIAVRGMSRVQMRNGLDLVHIGQTARNWTVDGVVINAASNGKMLKVADTGSIDVLALSDVRSDTAAGWEGYFEIRGPVGKMVLRSVNLIGLNSGGASTGAPTGFFDIQGAGWITELVLDDVSQKWGETFIFTEVVDPVANPPMVVRGQGGSFDAKRFLFVQRGAFDVRMSGASFICANDFARVANSGTTVHVRESGCTLTGAGASTPYTVLSSAVVRHEGVSMPVNADKAIIAGYQAGDQIRNANGALACGVGVLVSNGTTWKNLYSGATY
jgi:hypothetical protein